VVEIAVGCWRGACDLGEFYSALVVTSGLGIEALTWESGFEASRLREMPSSWCISSLVNPLLSKKETFLSVLASFTSSSSRNFRASSNTDVLGFASEDTEGSFCSIVGGGFEVSAFTCHEGNPPLGFASLSLIALFALKVARL
jgi:hypothetical protein